VLIVRDLAAGYQRGSRVLDGVTLRIERGEVVALTSISHGPPGRLGGYSDRRVCGVAGILPGGAGRREERWSHFALPAQRRSGLCGPWDDAA
jgi:hypothetical protein